MRERARDRDEGGNGVRKGGIQRERERERGREREEGGTEGGMEGRAGGREGEGKERARESEGGWKFFAYTSDLRHNKNLKLLTIPL